MGPFFSDHFLWLGWNLKLSQKSELMRYYYFPFMEIFIKWSFNQAKNFWKYLTSFSKRLCSCLKGFNVLFLNFLLPCNFHYIIFNWLIIAYGAAVIIDWWTSFEIVKNVKAKTFSSIVRFPILRSLRSFSIFTILHWNFIFYSSFYCRKNEHQGFLQFLPLD